MTDSTNYSRIRAEIAARKSSRKSENFDSLTASEQQDVLGFVRWMEDTGFSTKATRDSYKSYVVCLLAGEPMNSDRASGWKKFEAYLASK